MSVGLVEKPKRDVQQASAPSVQYKSSAGSKGALRGKSFDEQVQMLKPTEATQPPAGEKAPAPAGEAQAAASADGQQAATPAPEEKSAVPAAGEQTASPAGDAQQSGAGEGKSEADQLRESVAGQARDKSGKPVMDPKESKKIKEGYTDDSGKYHPPMQNFTTCIEFARGAMSDASADLYKGDAKKAQATNAAMSDAKVAWETAQGERTKARNYEGYAAKFQTTVDEYKKKAADARAKATELRARVDGESDAQYKQRSAPTVGLEANAKAWDSVAKGQQREVDRYKKMAAAAIAKADELDASNKAMIKATSPLGSRPKTGEFIILEQGQDDMYGKPGSGQFLAAGSFKHIAVFMGLVKDDPEYETWQVTEGGGELAGTNEIRVMKSDRMVVTKYTSESDLGTAKGSRLAGWIDAGELIKMRDRKSGKKA